MRGDSEGGVRWLGERCQGRSEVVKPGGPLFGVGDIHTC